MKRIPRLVINKIIQLLILNNFLVNSGWGFFSPIFTVFIVKYITSGDLPKAVEVVGFATLIYWVLKSILQIPIARIIDRIKGEGDDFWFLFWGNLLTAFIPLGFIFASQPWHVYLLHIIYAVGSAMNFPSWSSLFTNHIDKGQEALEWSINSTFLGIGFGVTNGIAAIIIVTFGYNAMFLIISIFLFTSTFILLPIRKYVSLRDGEHRKNKKFATPEIIEKSV
jgi:hypothetical protein